MKRSPQILFDYIYSEDEPDARHSPLPPQHRYRSRIQSGHCRRGNPVQHRPAGGTTGSPQAVTVLGSRVHGPQPKPWPILSRTPFYRLEWPGDLVRISSRHENTFPNGLKTGAVSPSTKKNRTSNASLNIKAALIPSMRARGRSASGGPSAMIETKVRLPIPNTTSRTISVTSVTIFTGDIGEAPDIADTNGRANRRQDKPGAGVPLFPR